MPTLKSKFYPIQLGFGTKYGAEIGGHIARHYYTHSHVTTKVFLKIDYRNVFNMVCREKMLKAVYDGIPQIFQFVKQCYKFPSNLFWNERGISSQRGCQQGDPLGPALFSITLHPLASKMLSECNLWYLDEGNLCGDPETVLKDFETLIKELKRLV